MLTATYLGLGAMNLDTGDGTGEKGGGDTTALQLRTFLTSKPPPPPAPGIFNTIKQALTPKPPLLILPRPPQRQNTIVPVTPPRTNTIVPVIRPGSGTNTIFTPPSPTQITVKPPATPAPGPIPTQGVVCIAPIVNVRAGGPAWTIVSCSTKGSRQVSLAEALRLTGGSSAPPPANYDPTAGRPPPVVLPTGSTGIPVQPTPATVPTATPAEAAASVITASSSTAQTVANLPPVQTAIPGAQVVQTDVMPAPAPIYKKKGFLIGAGVLAVVGIAAAIYGQNH